MDSLPDVTIHRTVLRGHVEDLQGSQEYPVFSWAKFRLGYTDVIVHGMLLMPPRLSEGDEVVVAGNLERGSFNAQACFKPGETADEKATRLRHEVVRRLVWQAPIVLFTFALYAWIWHAARGHIGMWLGPIIIMSPIYMEYLSRLEVYRQATVELALAMSRGEVKSADESFHGVSSEDDGESLSGRS